MQPRVSLLDEEDAEHERVETTQVKIVVESNESKVEISDTKSQTL